MKSHMRDWLARVGLFTVPHFFKPEFCAQLRTEVRQFPSQLPLVGDLRELPRVEQTVRRTDEIQISPQSWETIEEHLLGLKPQLEAYFQTKLSERERSNVLRYYQGNFFSWHADGGHDDPATKDRKVTTLMYLNGPDEESGSDSFSGGELEIYTYDLIPQEEYRTHCLKLSPQTGLLVAFGSQIRHQVQPVVKGTRYVISTFWR